MNKGLTYDDFWDKFQAAHRDLVKQDNILEDLQKRLQDLSEKYDNEELNLIYSALSTLLKEHKRVLHELGNTLIILSKPGLKLLIRKELDG